MAALWASPSDLARLRQARSAVLLVGGYDGSGNYGDVLQVATAIETVGRVPGAPLPVAVVERETRGHHLALLDRFGAQLGAIFLYFESGEDTAADDLVELGRGSMPVRTAIYVYGGGFLNHRWGGRKIDHIAAAERLFRRARLPLVASGLQVDEAAVVPGGVAHDALSRAISIGARDVFSLRYLRKGLDDGAAGRVELTGDDALPFLRAAPLPPEPVVNLHLNDGIWVSDDPDAMAARVVALLVEVGRAASMPLRLQPVVAYEDPRVSERRALAALLDRFGGELEEAGYALADPVDLLDDAIDGDLDRFRRARLTVACSYHVTLTSLLAGMPTVLLAENDYYEQKAMGLRDLFGLQDGRLVGARGDGEDAVAAAQALVDGPVRSDLLAHLAAGADRVVERYERGRGDTREALAGGLRGSKLGGAISRLRGA